MHQFSKCLSDLIIQVLIGVVVVAGTRRELAPADQVFAEHPTRGQDEAQVRWGGIHWPSEVLGMVLDSHIVRVI